MSLNLCADELVLLLAAPEQVASVTHLARDRHEFPFWRTARRYPANDGSLVSVAGMRPDLIVTMGGLARDREWLAGRIGTEILSLPYLQSLDDVEAAMARVARALGREERGAKFIRALRYLRRTPPRRSVDGLFLSGGGQTHRAGSLGAQWLALAGVRQPADSGGRVSAEQLLTDPPSFVVRSDYRMTQVSRGNFWPGFRLIRRARDIVTVYTDGRRWTCMGPSLMPEILRLRRAVAG